MLRLSVDWLYRLRPMNLAPMGSSVLVLDLAVHFEHATLNGHLTAISKAFQLFVHGQWCLE